MTPPLLYTSFSLSQRLRTPRNKSAGHRIHPTPTFTVPFIPSLTITITHPLEIPVLLTIPLPPAYIPPPPPFNPNTT
ncbi:hypothetical protein QR685DRAFT_453151 [Neurospora intermedia]|uniref:Uncharacterized protein n=1 Tax=Neurospora intermedia TaxID=5142 RepID=A0ABR3CZ80_NEUIN